MATNETAAIAAAIRASGFVSYDVSAGIPDTSKLARFRAPNGRALALQTNNVMPRIFVADDERAHHLIPLGECIHYAAEKSRHHHLRQIREFRSRRLLKFIVTSDPAIIRRALASFGAAA